MQLGQTYKLSCRYLQTTLYDVIAVSDRIPTFREETNTAAESEIIEFTHKIRYYLKYCHLELIYRVWKTEKGIVCRKHLMTKRTQQNQIEFQCILRCFEIFIIIIIIILLFTTKDCKFDPRLIKHTPRYCSWCDFAIHKCTK